MTFVLVLCKRMTLNTTAYVCYNYGFMKKLCACRRKTADTSGKSVNSSVDFPTF